MDIGILMVTLTDIGLYFGLQLFVYQQKGKKLSLTIRVAQGSLGATAVLSQRSTATAHSHAHTSPANP